MPCVSTNVFVRRTPTEVFDFLADARNLALWSSGVSSVEPGHVAPGPGAVYRYRFPGRRRPHHLVCADFEPGRRIAFRGQRMWGPLGTQVPHFGFDLLPHADGTLVRLSVTSSLSAALALLGPLVAMAWRRDLPADGLKLRELLGENRTAVEPLSAMIATGVDAAAAARTEQPAARTGEPAAPAAPPARAEAAPTGFDYAH
ncbi:SRPBCC family protein [Actinacidiphila sp. bgisy144]|uniref:SRPBCC family protein n=1 Tax=Actinacidiphila sp. bgisy144 TaxID=3413791 RepID=UPI003EB73EF2